MLKKCACGGLNFPKWSKNIIFLVKRGLKSGEKNMIFLFWKKQLGAETCAPVMFSGMTNTQWLRRLRLNVAWVIVLRVANSISVDYNCIVFEYFFGINWKLFRNCLFIRKVSSYFKEFVYFIVREFQRISNHAQRIRNLFYSLGMTPILMQFTNCLV